MTKTQDSLNWFAYNNIAGVVASALMIAAAFYGVSTRVAVVETKLDMLIAKNDKVLDNLNSLNSRMVTLETLHHGELN